MGCSTHRCEAFLVVKYPVLGTNFCLCLQVAAEFGSCGLCPPGHDRMLLQVMPKITNPLKGVFGNAEYVCGHLLEASAAIFRLATTI